MMTYYNYLYDESILTADTSDLKKIFDLPVFEFEQLVYHLLNSDSDQARVNGCMLCTLQPDIKRTNYLLDCTLSITDPSRTSEGVVALYQILSPEIIALKFIDYLEKSTVEKHEVIAIENAFYWLGITSASLSNRKRYYYLLTQHSWVLSIVTQLNASNEFDHIYIPDLIPISDEVIVDQFPYLAIPRVLTVPDWKTAHIVSLQILERILILFKTATSMQMKRTCVTLLNYYDFALLPTDRQEQIIKIYQGAQISSDENLRYLVSTPFHQALINSKID